MQKSFLSLLLICVLLLCISQDQPAMDRASLIRGYNTAVTLYNKAEKQLAAAGNNEDLLNKADALYQQSLDAFDLVIPLIQQSGDDSLLLQSEIKTGFIHYYFGNQAASKKAYLSALAIKAKHDSIADSLLFTPCIYTGGIYYEQDQFDSAMYYYKKAEQINDAYVKPLRDAQRLFNRMGAMQYETDNYYQARNYFEKAIHLTPSTDKDLLANYRINMATLLIKLEAFGEARAVFEELKSYPAFQNEVNHNLGIIHQREKDYPAAISFLRKVQYSDDNKKQIDLFYNFAVAFAGLGLGDSATVYIQKALDANDRLNEKRKNNQYGLILKLQGDELLKRKDFKEAIALYQQAIIQFHYSFNDTAIRSNPLQFNGVYSFVNLFNAFVAKADAFELWWQQEKDTGLLQTSLKTYQAAFTLAAYVERTYNSEASRLFLSNIKYSVHSKPIDISLSLYERTQKREWLESAYQFDQQNKASALALTLHENEFRFENENTNELIKKEATIKTDITRLSLKAANSNNGAISEINASIGEKEIELSKLQDKLNAEPGWAEKRIPDHLPTAEQLQQKLDKHTTLLSYHLSENELVTLFINASQFTYKKSAIDATFFNQVSSFKNSLYNRSVQQRYDGSSSAAFLYEKLLGPYSQELQNTKRLIIIPDDELNYLPFEALQDSSRNYLVEKFAVQYQYSTALFGKQIKTKKAPKNNLSFAPFTSGGVKSQLDSFAVLPASKNEIAQLSGKQFFDKEASKEHFLQFANQYNTIHLATHASVNNQDPSRSYIAFYPNNDDNLLYSREIAGLRLDSTNLVILSACETGAGQLVKGEGLMSLSRAFTYAGCPNVITSLWKAEDKTTAYLTQRLHHYLDNDYTKDEALQQAKIDLLHDKNTDPRFRSPNYWAHLIFIGDYEQAGSSRNRKWIFICSGFLILAFTGFLLRKSLSAKNKQARFP